MEIDRVAKICHVSAYVAYEHSEPVYKKTFKANLFRIVQVNYLILFINQILRAKL